MSNPNVRYFLLLRYKGTLSVVEHGILTQNLIPFYGKKQSPYSDDLWKMLIRKAHIEKNQDVDFCLISDDDHWNPPDRDLSVAAENESVWNEQIILYAIQLIDPGDSLEIVTESGSQLCRYAGKYPNNQPYRLTARFARFDAVKELPVDSETYQKKTATVSTPPDMTQDAGLTEEEYNQASALCRIFVDENRAAAKRGKK